MVKHSVPAASGYELQVEETDWRRENIGCTTVFVVGVYSLFDASVNAVL